MSKAMPKPPPASSKAVRAVMQGNRGRDTKPERLLRSALHRLGLRFRKDLAPITSLKCRADVVFPRERVAIFVDGCFWHCCPQHGNVPRDRNGYWAAKLRRNAERDLRNNHVLGSEGWLVMRFWEHEDPLVAAEKVRVAVQERQISLQSLRC